MVKRGALFVAVALVATSQVRVATAQPAQLQPNGLNLRQITSPTPGKVQVMVAADAPHDGAIGPNPDAQQFTLWVDDGAAKDLAVARNGSRGKNLATVVLVDDSGSYKRDAWSQVVIPSIKSYGATVTGGDKIGLVLFHLKTTPYSMHTSGAAVVSDLETALKRRSGKRTDLLSGLRAAIDIVTKEAPPGLREIILFTDGGDEGDFVAQSWIELKEKALQASVRIHLVLRDVQPIGSRDYVNFTRWLKDISKSTSGILDESGDPTSVAAQLKRARDLSKKWLVFDASLCGLKKGKQSNIRVEYVDNGTRKAWSGVGTLAETAWAPTAAEACPALCNPDCAAWQECIGGVCSALTCGPDQSCPGGAACVGGKCDKPCSPACEGWETCRAGTCEPKKCASHEVCGSGAECKDGTCAAITAGFFAKNLIWILIAAAATLLLGGFLLLRRKPQPEPEPLPEPEPEPVIGPCLSPLPIGEGFDLDALPEVHLEAIGGWITQGEKWRLFKRKMQVGGSSDPGDGNDIVFDIKQISGTHAEFQLYPSGDLWVKDLASANGTFVNGRRLKKNERSKIKAGDIIKLSKQLTLRVSRPGYEDVEPPPQADGKDSKPAGQPKKKKPKATEFDPGNRR